MPKRYRCPGEQCTRAFTTHADLIAHWESGTCPSGVTRNAVNRAVVSADRGRVITDGRRLIQGPDGGYAPRAHAETWATQGSWNGSAFECVLCHKTFARLPHLNAHLQSPAHADKLYKCPTMFDGCGMQFRTLSGVVQHVENGSCGVRRFQNQIRDVMDDLTRGMHRLTA